MASYQGHLTLSSILGLGVGSAAAYWGMDWGPVFLGAGLTALGGVLPDLDSDSSVPLREVCGLAAAAVPVLLFRRLMEWNFDLEQTLAILAIVYLLIRYGGTRLFGRFTVHRGMFHSIPAMLISGLAVFLLVHSPNTDLVVRLYLAGGTMLGFLSHLVLDELFSINFLGYTVKLNKFAGSALKLTSPSWLATAAAYIILVVLACLAYFEVAGTDQFRRLLGAGP